MKAARTVTWKSRIGKKIAINFYRTETKTKNVNDIKDTEKIWFIEKKLANK